MTISVATPWHGATSLLTTPRRYRKRRALFMECEAPLSSDDERDLREIAEGIGGFANVQRTTFNKKPVVMIEFADPNISDQDIEVKAKELFRLAVNHSAPCPHSTPPAASPVEQAMAVHSEVGRFDDFDR